MKEPQEIIDLSLKQAKMSEIQMRFKNCDTKPLLGIFRTLVLIDNQYTLVTEDVVRDRQEFKFNIIKKNGVPFEDVKDLFVIELRRDELLKKY